MTREPDVTIEVLYFEDCPSHAALLPRLQELLNREGVSASIAQTLVENDQDAQEQRFLGSPTLRIDGQDIDPGADDRSDFGMKCRLYATPDGLRATPSDEWIVAALPPKPP
jgi:hypothetical protein